MTPTMTAAHLLFAALDLVRAHRKAYSEYSKSVPMILPVRLGESETKRAPRGMAMDSRFGA
jgi:hypothetical protein